MSENKYPIGGYALPANDAVQNWFEENIDKDCSASSAIYKFRLWLESLQPKPSGGCAPGNYNDQLHLIIATCEEIAHSRHGLDHAIDRIKKYAEEGLKAKPAGAVWVPCSQMPIDDSWEDYPRKYILCGHNDGRRGDVDIHHVTFEEMKHVIQAYDWCEWLDESGTAPTELPTFWDVAKAFKWASEYGNEQGEQLLLTEDGQWLLLKKEDGVTETDELTSGNVAELYCLQNGFDKESGTASNKDVDFDFISEVVMEFAILYKKHNHCDLANDSAEFIIDKIKEHGLKIKDDECNKDAIEFAEWLNDNYISVEKKNEVAIYVEYGPQEYHRKKQYTIQELHQLWQQSKSK